MASSIIRNENIIRNERRKGYFIPMECVPDLDVIMTLIKYGAVPTVSLDINGNVHEFAADGLVRAEAIEV